MVKHCRCYHVNMPILMTYFKLYIICWWRPALRWQCFYKVLCLVQRHLDMCPGRTGSRLLTMGFMDDFSANWTTAASTQSTTAPAAWQNCQDSHKLYCYCYYFLYIYIYIFACFWYFSYDELLSLCTQNSICLFSYSDNIISSAQDLSVNGCCLWSNTFDLL